MRIAMTVGALLCFYVGSAFAQQSAFQSGDGQTSIYLNHPAATINFGDSKVSFGYVNRHSERKVFWGFEVFGKASTGVTTLFSSNKPKIPEGGGDFVFGFYDPFNLSPGDHPSLFVDDWWLVDVGYSRSSFYVSAVPTPIDSANRAFDRFRTVTAYNALVNGYFAFGIAAGAERRNNLDDLKKVTFETVLVPAPVGSANSVVKTQSGFFGNYREYIAAPVYTDLLFVLPPKVKIPKLDYQIGIDAFTRSDVAAFNRSTDGGLGIFLTEKGKPTKVIGGLSVSWNGGKTTVAVVASYNFK